MSVSGLHNKRLPQNCKHRDNHSMIRGKQASFSGRFFPHALLFLTFVFLFIFPKGGVRVANIPLTWGYLLLFLFSYLWVRSQKKLVLPRENRIVLFFLLPFQIVSLTSLSFHGIESFGFTFAFLISFFALPWIFLGFLSEVFEHLNFAKTAEYLRSAVFIVALFGLIQFILRFEWGINSHIPFLTINYGDIEIPEWEKCNDRGHIWIKLYSTFQNGNIYGVATSLLLPLFCYVEKSWWKRNLVFLAFLLTLSRTVWLGLVCCEILNHLYIRKVTKLSLMSLSLKLMACGTGAYLLARKMNREILDSSLGGRDSQLGVIWEWTLIGEQTPFEGIGEMIYPEVLKYFGFLGLITFLLGILSPLWTFFVKTPLKRQPPLKRALAAGLMLYLIVAVSDGALLYIPIMAFYWIVAALLLKKPTEDFSIDQITLRKA